MIGGDGWLHEVKFDGFRVHIDDLELYSRSGGRFGQRLPLLVDVVRELPARPAIIDGEIVASDARGVPDAWRLLAAHLSRSIKALVFFHCAQLLPRDLWDVAVEGSSIRARRPA